MGKPSTRPSMGEEKKTTLLGRGPKGRKTLPPQGKGKQPDPKKKERCSGEEEKRGENARTKLSRKRALLDVAKRRSEKGREEKSARVKAKNKGDLGIRAPRSRRRTRGEEDY